MTITHVASGANASNTSGVTVSVTVNTTGAKLIVVTASWLLNLGTPALSDNQGNTWIGLTERAISGGVKVRCFYCINPTVNASHIFTLGGASITYPSICVSAFNGDAFFYESETGATVTGASTSGQPGSRTPTINGSLLVTGQTVSVAGVNSINSGYTIGAQQTFVSAAAAGSAFAYLIQTTAAAVNPTWSGPNSTRAMYHAVFSETSALVSGTASVVDAGNQQVSVSATAASGGTSPYTYQWERSTTSGSGYSNVSGATSLTLTDTGLTNNTTYYYRIKSTDSAAATVTSNEISVTPVVSTTYTVDNSLIAFSPYNWRKSGSSFAETNNPGAYIKLKFNGDGLILLISTTINASLSAGNYPALSVQVNNGAHTRTQLTAGQTSLTLATGLGAGSGPHTAIVYVDAAWFSSDRWTTPASAVQVTGVRTTSGVLLTPDVFADSCIVFGDSNTEGYEANGSGVSVANQKAIYAFGVLVGRAMECEVGVVGFASQGWVTTGGGNVPTLANAWNLYSAGQSRLVSSLLSPAPKYVVISHGQNDGSSNIVSSATTTVNAIKAAAPNATICLCVPQTQGQLANLTSVAAATGAKLINPGEPFNVSPWGSTHMNAAGQGRYSAICAGKILLETATGGGTNTDLWDNLKTIARDNGLELIEQ